MKPFPAILILAVVCLFSNCSNNSLEEKGFSVNQASENTDEDKTNGISKDSLKLETRPSNVLLTGDPNYRLTTIYKVNYKKDDNTSFIGTNHFHGNYTDFDRSHKNNWNHNFMPGIEAVYGYNMVNISHYDITGNKQKNLFVKPVLIKTLYYPSFSKDTLNSEAVNRNYFMVSVYNEDTNKDNFINVKDLRRFYFFDIKGENRKPLLPENYSVVKSEYDPANDFMYVFAQFDENENGQGDENEKTHIFWINLKDPAKTGRLY